jgi:type I restriction enzyme, S subunit
VNAPLPLGWDVVPLESLLVTPRDLTYGVVQPGAHESDGVPIARVSDIRDGRIDLSNPLRIAANVESSYARSRIEGGELLVTLVGTVGECAVAPDVMRGWNVARAVAVARIRPDVGARWVRRSISERDAVARILSRVNTTVQTTLNLADLRQVPVVLPPKSARDAIGQIADALDDKIESNRRLVDLLPRLIRAVVSQALADAALHIAVADLARFVNGGAYTRGASGVGRMVIRIAELNSGPGSSTVYSDISVSDDKTARPGDLLMSWSGSLGVYRWVLGEAIINQHIFKVIPSDGYPAWLVHDRLHEVIPVFQGIAKDKATTMGHIQRGHLESTQVEIPSTAVIARLDDQLASLWRRLLLAERESIELSALRDALLPELLSGRIRPPEGAKAVEDLGA